MLTKKSMQKTIKRLYKYAFIGKYSKTPSVQPIKLFVRK